MTDRETLLTLAERVEQAAAPDAGLDLAIWKALSEMPGFKHPSPIWRFDVTASLDAAVTLYETLPEVIPSCPRKASAAALRARAAMG